MNLVNGCWKQVCTVKKASGLCKLNARTAKNIGMNKNKKKPESRCKIEAMAVIGKRIVNKLRLIGRLLTDCKPFNGSEEKDRQIIRLINTQIQITCTFF